MPGPRSPQQTKGRSDLGDELEKRGGGTHRFLLVASPDDYLLEIARDDAVNTWAATHPDGERTDLDPAPPPDRLLRELISPSLFASARLIVVRDVSPYFEDQPDRGAEIAALAETIRRVQATDITLILTTVAKSEPKGTLADAVREAGQVRFLPLPATPKPWEEVRVSHEQHGVLEAVIRRVAPRLLDSADVVEALIESYGFKPRELAQAASRLVLGGEISADAVRAQAGVAECSAKDLEGVLIRRDPRVAVRFLARLAAGGHLIDWWGKDVPPEKTGAVLGGALGRLLRQALAVRAHARRCGLEGELDPRRCGRHDWYFGPFKTRLFPLLDKDIESVPDSPLAGVKMWAMHHIFRLAAGYEDEALLAALAALTDSGVERERRRDQVLAMLSTVIVGLITSARATTSPASVPQARSARPAAPRRPQRPASRRA